MLLAACGAEKKEETSSLFEQVESREEVKEETREEAQETKSDVLSEEQAFTAVQNYCVATIPGFDVRVTAIFFD